MILWIFGLASETGAQKIRKQICKFSPGLLTSFSDGSVRRRCAVALVLDRHGLGDEQGGCLGCVVHEAEHECLELRWRKSAPWGACFISLNACSPLHP